jgi:transcriptional regulator with XRE-family HTH domain
MGDTPDLWATWGAEVKRRRKAKGWSQHQLALASRLVVTTISAIETGKAGGSDQTKMKIAAALEAEVADVFTYPTVTEAAS